MNPKRQSCQVLLLFTVFLFSNVGHSLPLSTSNRWIVDAKTGERVKLRCVNWPSHVETMLTEGLHKQPLQRLAAQVVKLQFNCVRLTFATYMFTRYSNLTVAESFDGLNLTVFKERIDKYNPFILNMTLVQAYVTVADELWKHGIMVDADNHVSKPTWCCGSMDGNGFFGDRYFDPDEWIQGLTAVAKLFHGKPSVIGIGLRNELRGDRQNADDWYRYIYKAASSVHEANPDVLIFASGLSYASDLSFLKNMSLGSNFDNKLVYETHWYPFSWGSANDWKSLDVNDICYSKTNYLINKAAFTNSLDNPIPIFLGEVGTDTRGLEVSDDHFLSCFLAYAAGNDIDWGWWAFQGSYYFREGKVDTEETFGVMDFNWNRVRNPAYQQRLHLIKDMLQDPSSNCEYYKLFHPQSGSCIHASEGEFFVTNCKQSSLWIREQDGGFIKLKGTNKCLRAVGDRVRPILSTDCSSNQSSWQALTASGLHLAAKDNENGEYLCLHKESPYTSTVLTSKCVFATNDFNNGCHNGDCPNSAKDITSQWFKLVKTNIC